VFAFGQDVATSVVDHAHRWLWFPAFAGTTWGELCNLTAAWQIRGNFHANPWRARRPSPSRIRREKAGSCRMKKPRLDFAFGSSQRNRMTLMFGAARLWRPGVSASRSFGFRIMPCGMRVAPRRFMRHKPLQATMEFAACESSRRIMLIKRLKRRAFSLSSARRKPRTAFGLPQRA
jgi:hypothetical protein